MKQYPQARKEGCLKSRMKDLRIKSRRETIKYGNGAGRYKQESYKWNERLEWLFFGERTATPHQDKEAATNSHVPTSPATVPGYFSGLQLHEQKKSFPHNLWGTSKAANKAEINLSSLKSFT